MSKDTDSGFYFFGKEVGGGGNKVLPYSSRSK